MFLMKTCVAICKAAAKVRTPFRHTTQEQIREAMKEKKNARKLVEQYAPTRDLDVMAIVARNQLVEKQFTEGEHTKTIENINPVLSEKQQNPGGINKAETHEPRGEPFRKTYGSKQPVRRNTWKRKNFGKNFPSL